MTHIVTPRLVMKQITLSDWPLFLRLHQEPEVIRYAFDPPTNEEILQRFHSRLPKWTWESDHWLCLGIFEQESNVPIGVTGLCVTERKEGEIELGYLLLPEFHGKGIGTESLLALLDYIKQSLPVKKIIAIVTDGNLASTKVLEKSGFILAEREVDAYQIGGIAYDDLIFHYQF